MEGEAEEFWAEVEVASAGCEEDADDELFPPENSIPIKLLGRAFGDRTAGELEGGGRLVGVGGLAAGAMLLGVLDAPGAVVVIVLVMVLVLVMLLGAPLLLGVEDPD